MKIRNKKRFYLGLVIGIFLFASYFIKFSVDSGGNYVVKDSLLGILIFHNPIVFGIYIFIFAFLILSGLARVKII